MKDFEFNDELLKINKQVHRQRVSRDLVRSAGEGCEENLKACSGLPR